MKRENYINLSLLEEKMEKVYVINKNVVIKNTTDDGMNISVKTEWIKNNRYYIKLYNNMKKKGLKWPETTVSCWTHDEEKELFGVA